MPPSTACPSTRGTAATAGHSSRGVRRWSRTAKNAVASASTVTTKTRKRWENSISEWIVPPRKQHAGVQFGHVEQPSPEPVPPTRPPTLNNRIVTPPAVATASFWKRFIVAVRRPRRRARSSYRPEAAIRLVHARTRRRRIRDRDAPQPSGHPTLVDEELRTFLDRRRAEVADADLKGAAARR